MPTPYVWGWVVVLMAALGLLFALRSVLRGVDAPLLKSLAGAWLFVILVVPAQIPRNIEDYAPALVVFLFETYLQRDGNPAAAGRILAAATVVAAVLGVGWFLAGRLRRRGPVAPG